MDKLPVPRHLRDIAGEVKQTAYSVRVKLCCPCGCELFRVGKSTWSEDELRRMEAYEAALKKLVLGYTCRRLPNGQHQRRRNLFGLIPLRWQNFDMPQAPGYWDVQCIRVICDACQATHVVFDSRCHGYEGWAAEWSEDTLDWQPQWRSAARNAGTVTVLVENRDFEVFLEENPELTPEVCSDLYENISIRYKTDGGKSREVFSRETA